MATLTTLRSGSGAARKAIHAGANSVSVIYSLTGSFSAGDVLQLVKIPAGAVVHDVICNFQFTGLFVGTVGDSVSTGRYIASVSMTAQGIVRANAGIPYSYSADDVLQLNVNAVTTGTISGWIGVTVLYNMDNGPSLGS